MMLEIHLLIKHSLWAMTVLPTRMLHKDHWRAWQTFRCRRQPTTPHCSVFRQQPFPKHHPGNVVCRYEAKYELGQYIVDMSDTGFGLTRDDVMQTAYVCHC